MLIVEWRPINETEEVPPLGDELRKHLENRKGPVKHASCSAWNLFYETLLANGFPVGDVAFTDTGKPYFPESDVFFSLSHSHDICAVTIADRPVGADVEMIKPSYPLHMIERSLTITEQDSFDGDYTRFWCRKEAVAKMTGEGITGYPVNIDTTRYEFNERQLEWGKQKYWLVATITD